MATKHQITVAMRAAQDAIRQVEQGHSIGTAQLVSISVVTGDSDKEMLKRRPRTGYRTTASAQTMSWLLQFVDDCELMLLR